MRVSVNKPTKKTFKKGTNPGASGDNITSNAFGFDDPFSGQAFGDGEFGGIEHFRNRTQPEGSH